MTIARAWWRLPPLLMAKPKSPWGGGDDGDGGGDGGGTPGGGGDAGPRNPWAQPPSGPRQRAPRPTSLDDFLRRTRGGGGGRRGGFQFPGGGNAGTLWMAAVGAIVLLWVLLTSVHVVGPQENGVVTYFGRYSGTLQPGWSLTLPAPIATVQKVNIDQIRSFQFPQNSGQNLVLTGDQYLVDLSYTVRWRIVDPQKYVFELKGPDETVKAAAESAVRAIVANTTLDEVIGRGKSAIESQVTVAMQKILDDYQSGIRIVGVTLNNANAPAQALEAFKQVSVAQQEYQSNITQARLWAQQWIALAEGEAQAFNLVYAQYKLAPEVTRRRMYYETMEQVLSTTNKTIVEPRGVAPFLPILPAGTRAPDPAQGGSR